MTGQRIAPDGLPAEREPGAAGAPDGAASGPRPFAPRADGVLLRERRGPVALLTLNRPAKRNALDRETLRALVDAFADADRDPAVRVVVITGNGSAFCSGMDLAAFLAGFRPDIAGADFPFNMPPAKPVLAAINGPAIAGGLELALSCDVVVAARSASFGLPEVRRGLVAAGGGVFRLPRRAGGTGLEMVLTGDPIDAVEAHRIGIVDRLVDDGDLMPTALRIAERIADASPAAVAESLRVGRLALDLPEHELWRETVAGWPAIADGPDAAEGVAAFLARRSPHWRRDGDGGS